MRFSKFPFSISNLDLPQICSYPLHAYPSYKIGPNALKGIPSIKGRIEKTLKNIQSQNYWHSVIYE